MIRKTARPKKSTEDLRVFCSTPVNWGGFGARRLSLDQYGKEWSQPHHLGKGPYSCFEGSSVLAKWMCYTCVSPGMSEGSLRTGVLDHHRAGCAGAPSRIPERNLPSQRTESLPNPENGKYFTAYYSYLPRLDHERTWMRYKQLSLLLISPQLLLTQDGFSDNLSVICV